LLLGVVEEDLHLLALMLGVEVEALVVCVLLLVCL
jgi:hypothetical protein